MRPSRKKNALEQAVWGVLERLRPAFSDSRVFQRFARLVCGLLAAEGRRTVTAMMATSGRDQSDWSADYRLLSRAKWEPAEVFALLLRMLVDLLPNELIVASIDDTNLRKTGTHIPGVAYRRDPMSPPFQTNLVRAQRFIQTSLVAPFNDGASASRAIPIAFTHAPSAGKIAKSASSEQRAEHRKRERALSLSNYGRQAIRTLRDQLDDSGRGEAKLLIAVDGSYTNGNIIKHLPDKTVLIGRIRKDAVLHQRPGQTERGRPRQYSQNTLTPEQVRTDESLPWKTVTVWAAGASHATHIKEVSPLLWRKTGADLPLRLIVIRPLAYRRTKTSKLLYRAPAFLITTDLDTPTQQLVQAYFWRWDIEVNHRDEKQLIGVGQAQVRSPRSAERAPAFAVAAYSILLIAAARAFGLGATDPIDPLPKWLAHTNRRRVRLSTRHLLTAFRQRTDTRIDLPNFDHFALNLARHTKSPKSQISIEQAISFATN